MMATSLVGIIIKKYREIRGWTQAELAEEISLSQQTVQKYEAGKTQLKLKRLNQIADALGVPVTSLLIEESQYRVKETGEPEEDTIPLKITKDEVALVTTYRTVKDKTAKKAVLSLLKIVINLREGKNKTKEKISPNKNPPENNPPPKNEK